MSDSLAGMYQQVILDHAKQRTGEGLLERADASHHELNPTCGDEITLEVALEPGTDLIAAVGWKGNGCSISMASASIFAGMAPGLTLSELQSKIDAFREMMRSRGTGEPDEDVLEDAVVFHGTSKYVMRVKCAMLAWVAAEAATAKIPR